MTLEELRKADHEEEETEQEEEDEESDHEDTNKSFDEALLQTLSTLTEHVKSLTESQVNLEARMKAMEKPTDLPLKPSGSSGEDVGAKVTIPDEYQSNSVQASLDDDGDETENDKGGLSMQTKAQKANFDFETETPRPSAGIENVNKSTPQVELNMILKDARAIGYDQISQVGLKILKGDYYTPSEQERLF